MPQSVVEKFDDLGIALHLPCSPLRALILGGLAF
jgi:hypothetical protein